MAGFRGGVAAAESVVCWWKQIAERLADGDSNAPMVLSGKVTKNSCVSACLGRRGEKKKERKQPGEAAAVVDRCHLISAESSCLSICNAERHFHTVNESD